MDRRVRIIRFYLILAGLALACVLWPEWAVFAWPLVGIIPCPECCAQCTPFWEDDFATDQLSTDYTTVSGTFAVGSGVLTTTSSGALIVADAVSTSGHGRVSVEGKVSTTGTILIAGSYTDSNNYLFAEVIVNGASSQCKLWRRSGGTNTQIGVTANFTAASDTFYSLVLCWDGGFASVVVSSGAGVVLSGAAGAYTGTGTKAGLGGTPAALATLTFDDFLFTPHPSDNSDCPSCGFYCPYCATAPPTGRWQATIPALGNQTCANCADYAGTYIVEQLVIVSSNQCIWRYYLDDEICDSLEAIQVARSSAAAEQIQVLIAVGMAADGSGGVSEQTWNYDATTSGSKDCDDFSSTSIPPSNTGTGTNCALETVNPATLTAI